MADTYRLRQLRKMNPDFAAAEARGDLWAVQRADMVRGLDGKAYRQHPERAAHEDGRPRNWCGSCLHPEGCVTCDLHEMPHNIRKNFGACKTN